MRQKHSHDKKCGFAVKNIAGETLEYNTTLHFGHAKMTCRKNVLKMILNHHKNQMFIVATFFPLASSFLVYFSNAKYSYNVRDYKKI